METVRHSESPHEGNPDGRVALMSAAHALTLHLAVMNQAVTDADAQDVVCLIAGIFNVQTERLIAFLQHIEKFPSREEAIISAPLPMPVTQSDLVGLKGTEAPSAPPKNHVFRKKGQIWVIRFAGGDEFVLLPCKGAAYLHLLLSNPGKIFSVVDLVYEVAKVPQKYALGGVGESSDADSLVAYREKCRELHEEMERATANNDEAQRDRIRGEVEWLARHIKNESGLGGRLRQQANDHERLRKSFRAAIRRVVKEIDKHDHALAAYLTPPHLNCGNNPYYDPLNDIEWDT